MSRSSAAGMKMKRLVFSFAVGFVLVLAPWGSAQAFGGSNPSEAEPLNLLPAPKEVRFQPGGFRVGPKTRIVVEFGHQTEDRIAAETLAEDVADQAGWLLDIVGTKARHKAQTGAIMLMRLDDERVRQFLSDKGLSADVGEQGYLLFSDKTHLIVAANSGQGLFSGVQTLRQLLRPDGKDLICPAVTIRDWPNLVLPAGASDVTRDNPPALPRPPG